MSGFGDVVRRRQMVRRYDPDRPVPDAVVQRLLGYALRAPSAGFTQGVSFLLCDRDEDRERFWSVTSSEEDGSEWLSGMGTGPVLVQVWTSAETYLDRYAQPDKGWSDRDPDRWPAPFWYVDAGMAAMAILYGAVDEGLGACFFGVPPERIVDLRAAFGVPEQQLIVGVVSLGYPAATAGAAGSPARRPRRDPTTLVFRGRWASSAT